MLLVFIDNYSQKKTKKMDTFYTLCLQKISLCGGYQSMTTEQASDILHFILYSEWSFHIDFDFVKKMLIHIVKPSNSLNYFDVAVQCLRQEDIQRSFGLDINRYRLVLYPKQYSLTVEMQPSPRFEIAFHQSKVQNGELVYSWSVCLFSSEQILYTFDTIETCFVRLYFCELLYRHLKVMSQLHYCPHFVKHRVLVSGMTDKCFETPHIGFNQMQKIVSLTIDCWKNGCL